MTAVVTSDRRQAGQGPVIISNDSEGMIDEASLECASHPADVSTTPSVNVHGGLSESLFISSLRAWRNQSGSPRRRHRRQRRRRFRFKQKERNFVSALCSMVAIVNLCTAMAEPSWFHIRGGGCRNNAGRPIHTIGIYEFFYPGHFELESPHQTASSASQFSYRYGASTEDVLHDCVNPKTVQVMRSIIALCFIGTTFSLMAFFLDLSGPSTRTLKFLRRNAVFNILTVLTCVTINGFSFLVTQILLKLQNDTKVHRYSKVEIRFDVSFYLVASAGAISVIGCACNLLKRHPRHNPERSDNSQAREQLLGDFDDMDFMPSLGYDNPACHLPPPPPYSP